MRYVARVGTDHELSTSAGACVSRCRSFNVLCSSPERNILVHALMISSCQITTCHVQTIGAYDESLFPTSSCFQLLFQAAKPRKATPASLCSFFPYPRTPTPHPPTPSRPRPHTPPAPTITPTPIVTPTAIHPHSPASIIPPPPPSPPLFPSRSFSPSLLLRVSHVLYVGAISRTVTSWTLSAIWRRRSAFPT